MESLSDYLDIIEDIIESGRNVPFSNRVSIEKEKIFEVISEIRMNLPVELRNAQRIIEEHDKIIDEARTRAEQLISAAEQRCYELTNESEIVAKATEHATEVMEETKKNARELRINAIDYADEVIAKTEANIKHARDIIANQYALMEEYMDRIIDVMNKNRQELHGSK